MTALLDVLERVVWTAIQAGAASIVVTEGVGWGDLQIAGLAAALAAAKALSVEATSRLRP